jgi:hypothetical protein
MSLFLTRGGRGLDALKYSKAGQSLALMTNSSQSGGGSPPPSPHSFLVQTNMIPILWSRVLSTNCIRSAQNSTPSKLCVLQETQFADSFASKTIICSLHCASVHNQRVLILEALARIVDTLNTEITLYFHFAAVGHCRRGRRVDGRKY